MHSFSPSAIYHLDGSLRQVVQHLYVERGSTEDLMNRWGVSEASIKCLVQRARKKLAAKEVVLPDRRVKLRLKYRAKYGRHGL